MIPVWRYTFGSRKFVLALPATLVWHKVLPQVPAGFALFCVEGRFQPLQAVLLYQYRIKSAGRQRRLVRQPVAGRQHNAPSLGGVNAAAGSAKLAAGAAAHFHKHHRAIARAQDEVYLAPTAPRRPIIALYQPPAPRQRVAQRRIFGMLARRARHSTGLRRLFSKETH